LYCEKLKDGVLSRKNNCPFFGFTVLNMFSPAGPIPGMLHCLLTVNDLDITKGPRTLVPNEFVVVLVRPYFLVIVSRSPVMSWYGGLAFGPELAVNVAVMSPDVEDEPTEPPRVPEKLPPKDRSTTVVVPPAPALKKKVRDMV
jgi:hypothetical protein